MGDVDEHGLRERRQSLGWTQVDVAERVGVTPRIISNAEHGRVSQGPVTASTTTGAGA